MNPDGPWRFKRGNYKGQAFQNRIDHHLKIHGYFKNILKILKYAKNPWKLKYSIPQKFILKNYSPLKIDFLKF